MRLLDKHVATRLLPLVFLAALSGCGGSGGGRSLADMDVGPVGNGPAADYPVVIGAPYNVNGVEYTPADVMNYDEVGFAALDTEGGSAITGAHHTLPLPSYVEVTSLESGRTILLRLERRGPMAGNELVALSPGATEQLGAKAGTPVRVRRVNPQEPERAALRGGTRAPERMETPASLVEVLRRKLPGGAPAATVPATAAKAPDAPSSSVTAPTLSPVPSAVEEDFATAFAPAANEGAASASTSDASAAAAPATPPVESGNAALATVAEQPVARPAATPSTRSFVVQAGAFSTKERADRVAGAIVGEVSKFGSLYRVRTGPFTSRQEAEASLAKVKAAGYSDARIY